MGIETDSDIDYGRIFGPFPEVGQISKSFFIGLLTTDEQNEHHNIKINVNSTGLSVTWLPYIRAARTEEEQNMEAYTKNGHIYYRALRIIKAGEELLVWYSKDFCQILGIPIVKSQGNADNHVCDMCGTKFRFPYPLMAHVKFRCTGSYFSQVSLVNDTSKTETTDGSTIIQQHGEPSTHSSKRPAKTNVCPLPVKRLFESTVTEINNNDNAKSSTQNAAFLKVDSNTDVAESWSAFRKVEKTKQNGTECKSDSLTFSTESIARQRLHESIQAKCENGLNKYLCNKSSISVGSEKEVAQRLGMYMSNSWMVPGSYTAQQLVDQPAINNKTVNYSAEKVSLDTTRELARNSAEGTSIQLQNNDILHKQLILEELQNFQFSYFKPNNPMVDKLMTTAATMPMIQRPMRALGAAQNWCAKCNASFRMTSDLVYHMRSHHKREFDPMKRKREEKLQCNVCQETFKERHHLTRHMTSHT